MWVHPNFRLLSLLRLQDRSLADLQLVVDHLLIRVILVADSRLLVVNFPLLVVDFRLPVVLAVELDLP